MSLPEAFRPFVEGASCAVMARLSVEYLVDDETLSMLFAEHAHDQYEHQLTLANLVDVMLDVACGIHGSPRSAFQARADEIATSLSAFYGKLNRKRSLAMICGHNPLNPLLFPLHQVNVFCTAPRWVAVMLFFFRSLRCGGRHGVSS